MKCRVAVLWFCGDAEVAQSVDCVRPFKKACPFDVIRSVQPKAGTFVRPCFLPNKVSQNDNQKGTTGFRGDTVHDA